MPAPDRQLAIETLAWLDGEGRPVQAFLDVTRPLQSAASAEGSEAICNEVGSGLDGSADPRTLTDLTVAVPDRLLAELHLAVQDALVGAWQRCVASAWTEMAEGQEDARRTQELIDQRLGQLEEAAR